MPVIKCKKPLSCILRFLLSRVPKPLVPGDMGHFKTPGRGRTPLVQCLPVRYCSVPKLSPSETLLGRIIIKYPSFNRGLTDSDSLSDLSKANSFTSHFHGLTGFVLLVG